MGPKQAEYASANGLAVVHHAFDVRELGFVHKWRAILNRKHKRAFGQEHQEQACFTHGRVDAKTSAAHAWLCTGACMQRRQWCMCESLWVVAYASVRAKTSVVHV